MKKLTPNQVTEFQKTVYAYYRNNKRDLPWRKKISPYRILVSEIMLQQTQVDRVIPKFNAWMQLFPTFQTLAAASTKEVLAAWSGLGYNRRAMALYTIARTIHRLPRTPEALQQLPGIGAATAAAICAYAFEQPIPYIETNIRTVYLHHFFKSQTNITDVQLLPLVAQTLDTKHPRAWYWALMDYGVHLKKLHHNPSRRSAHYTKQSKFEGSNRQLRGKILKILLTSGKGRKFSTPTVVGIAKLLKVPTKKVAPVVAQLCKDGFIHAPNGRWRIV